MALDIQYHDGWWKGGNENSHDPSAEEWFGLFEFSSLNDKYGSARPVWSAYEKYNQAIITNPKNGHIYQNNIPIEFFTTSEVASYSISNNNNVLISESLDGTYFTSELILELNEEIKDIELVLDFFNSNGDTLKSETISILNSNTELELPEITLEVSPENIVPGGQAYLNMHVTTNPQFSIEENKINYVLHPHIGFDPGIVKSKVMSFADDHWAYSGNFYMPQDTKVATFGAGFTIVYGKFKKRISNQKILIYGDWADPIAAAELITGIMSFNHNSVQRQPVATLFQNYPNPFNPSTSIQFIIPKAVYYKINIYSFLRDKVAGLVDGNYSPGVYNIQYAGKDLPSGIYLYQLIGENINITKKMILMK